MSKFINEYANDLERHSEKSEIAAIFEEIARDGLAFEQSGTRWQVYTSSVSRLGVERVIVYASGDTIRETLLAFRVWKLEKAMAKMKKVGNK